MSAASDNLAAFIREHGITFNSDFVPLSASRNAGKWPSLNWRVSVFVQGRAVLVADYSAGTAHAPAYKNPPRQFGKCSSEYARRLRDECVAHECEHGKKVTRYSDNLGGIMQGKEKIFPDACDVLASLALDASAIDSPTFADWCDEFGYSADSISAKASYDECLVHALALRAALGSAAFDSLRDIASEY